jgi:hypothetical protein
MTKGTLHGSWIDLLRLVALWVAIGTALLAFATLGASHASALPSDPAAAESPHGVTLGGVGVAHTEAKAIPRAVNDAKARAASIAGELGLTLGPIEYVDQINTPSQILGGGSDGCQEAAKGAAKSCSAAATVLVSFEIEASAASDEEPRIAAAAGSASVAVDPSDRTSEKSIKSAVLGARREATQEAVAVARRNTGAATHAAGLRVGRILSVSESQASLVVYPPIYPSIFQDAAAGTIAPGRFCGVRRTVVRLQVSGKPKLVRRARRICRVPRTYDVSLEIQVEMVKRG